MRRGGAVIVKSVKSIGILSGFFSSLCVIAHLSALECVIFASVTSLNFQKYVIEDPLWPVDWVIDKIADLLEYFLGSYSKFSSVFYNK